MFNKLKQLKDLRSQAKQMQNALAGETVSTEKDGVKIIMNGNMEIQSVEINKELTPEKLEKILPTAFNQAIKETQKLMAKKMQEMGNLPF